MIAAVTPLAGFGASLVLGVSFGAREAALGAVASALLSLLLSWRNR